VNCDFFFFLYFSLLCYPPFVIFLLVSFMGNSACCEGINNCYLQDESKTWEDDAVDKGSLEEVLSIVCHRYIL
jgi:hypothetical protein